MTEGNFGGNLQLLGHRQLIGTEGKQDAVVAAIDAIIQAIQTGEGVLHQQLGDAVAIFGKEVGQAKTGAIEFAVEFTIEGENQAGSAGVTQFGGEAIAQLMVVQPTLCRLHTAMEVPAAEMQRGEGVAGGVPHHVREQLHLPDRQTQRSQPLQAIVQTVDVVAVVAATAARLLGINQGLDRIGRRHLFGADAIREHQLLIDRCAVVIVDITGGGGQLFHEFGFQVHAGHLGGEGDRPARIAQNLGALRAGNFLKKPAATSEHQQGVALHFQQA